MGQYSIGANTEPNDEKISSAESAPAPTVAAVNKSETIPQIPLPKCKTGLLTAEEFFKDCEKESTPTPDSKNASKTEPKTDEQMPWEMKWDYPPAKTATPTKRRDPAGKDWAALAAQGNAHAQYTLATMYLQGKGVIQDNLEAVRWFRESATHGNVQAQYKLGTLYAGQQAVGRDYVEAVRWFREAAAQGNAPAQYELGSLYSMGQGVGKRDYIRAYMWLTLSAKSGDAETLGLRDRLAATMDYGQITEGERLARECQARKFKRCD